MELYGKGSGTTKKRMFRVVGPTLTRKIISPNVHVVDPLKPISTRPGFPKVEIEMLIYLQAEMWSKETEPLRSIST